MPDHFHGLLFVTRPLGCHLGQVIKGFKLGCNKAARALGVFSPARVLSPAILSQGTGQGAGQETGRATGRGAGLWAAGFTDKILFREGQLKKMSDYLDDNPRRLAVKALFPELFKVAGERQIAREALKAGYPLITLQNKGFAKLQKPGGQYFDACAKGDLLMMAPAAWPYQPGEKKMTRFDATALNRLCQWLAGETAAEIDYKGMKPANVDACAKTAACVSGV